MKGIDYSKKSSIKGKHRGCGSPLLLVSGPLAMETFGTQPHHAQQKQKLKGQNQAITGIAIEAIEQWLFRQIQHGVELATFHSGRNRVRYLLWIAWFSFRSIAIKRIRLGLIPISSMEVRLGNTAWVVY